MFQKVLIANRGEIALRVMRTLREMGVTSVAVHSEADARAPHAQFADESVCIGPAPAAESYLRADKILEAAKKTGAQAVHPGYGFLSESAAFAEACEKAGLVFIGPPASAMRAVGDKASARALAEKEKVPVVPGARDLADDKAILKAAKAIGFPLLLKASAGGGGKGMRLVHDAAELKEAAASARRESKAAFGDDTLILEKYIHPARHVEVQMMADAHGNAIALGERECSLQRRHQKIIEESPSPHVDAALRAKLYEAACKLAKAAGYQGAGTVEFLLDESGHFHFLEVNARLQVEHPVTEAVTGLDLVRLQLEVAAGAPLPFRQEDVVLRGHAMEARLYAEDADNDFLPASGRLHALRWPALPGLRVDSGVREGGELLPYYDPMLAKIIAWAPDREQARRLLVEGLRGTVALGAVTNLPFLVELLESEMVKKARTFTHSVEDWMKEREPRRGMREGEAELLFAAALALHSGRPALARKGGTAPPPSPWRQLGRWRLGE